MNYELNDSRKCKCVSHNGTEKWQGTVSGYMYHKCPCDNCKKGWRDYHRQYGYDHGGTKPRVEVELQCSNDSCDKVFTTLYAQSRYCSEECKAAVTRKKQRDRYTVIGSQHVKSKLVRRRRALWEAQNGLCALCRKPVEFEKATLDHDHNCCSSKAKQSCGNCDRGVLHNSCNAILGFANDDTALLLQAVDYLIGTVDATAQTLSTRPARIA